MKQTILIAHPERGRLTERTVESLTLDVLQKAVGGYIEHAPVAGLTEEHIVMLVNEDGLLAGLPVNENMRPFFYVGNCVFVKLQVNEDGELDFVGLDSYQLEWLHDWLSGLSYIGLESEVDVE